MKKKVLNILSSVKKVTLATVFIIGFCGLIWSVYLIVQDRKEHQRDIEAKDNFHCASSENVLGDFRIVRFDLRDIYLDHLSAVDSLKYLDSYEWHYYFKGDKRVKRIYCLSKKAMMNYCESNSADMHIFMKHWNIPFEECDSMVAKLRYQPGRIKK